MRLGSFKRDRHLEFFLFLLVLSWQDVDLTCGSLDPLYSLVFVDLAER